MNIPAQLICMSLLTFSTYASPLNLAPYADPVSTEDGSWIDPFIGDARIVLIGEEVHGVSEHIQIKGELARRLIDHHGFTHIAIEDDTFKVKALAWKLDSGQPPHQAFSSSGLFWCWAVEELADAIQHCTRSPNDWSLIGFDVQSAAFALAFLQQRTNDTILNETLTQLRDSFATGHEKFDNSAASELIDKAETLIPDEPLNKQALNQLRRVTRVWAGGKEHGPRMNARDQGMADSISDILNGDPKARIVVFAHNAHAGYTDFYASFTGGVTPLAKHLSDAFPGSTRSIGLLYTSGTILLDPRAREAEGKSTREYGTPKLDTQAAAWSTIPHERWMLSPSQVLSEQPDGQLHQFLTEPPTGNFNNYGPARSLADSYDIIVGYRTVSAATPLNK